MRHTFRETLSGLRRNLAMTIAVIVTIAVSLSLFGAGLLAAKEVDLVKGRWYDKIEITVFLCVKDSQGGNCTPGEATTDAQREVIRDTLKANPEVEEVYYESQAEAYAAYRETFKDSPLVDILTEDQIMDSFRIKLKDPSNYKGIVTEARGLQGVQSVQDLHTALDPMFNILNGMKWTTIAMSAALLLAAALQIGNTIRMSAFTRRREIGIMRLVGASNSYIMLPFLLESLIAGIIGALLGCGVIAALVYLIQTKVQLTIRSLPWIGWNEGFVTMGWMALVGVLLSVIHTLIATRKYLRV